MKYNEFVLYGRATQGGGAIVKSTSSGGGTTRTTTSGGGTTATSSSGGGVSKSTDGGGGTVPTTSSQIFGTFAIFTSDPVSYTSPEEHIHRTTFTDQFDHNHSVAVPSHSHNFSTPNHTHNVTIPNHSHDVSIPAHTHSVEMPDHTHEIEHGIYKLSEIPTEIEIRVDGNLVPYNGTSGDIDLIPYIAKDDSGKVIRGAWHEITLRPNTLARINANVTKRVFIQSQLGGTY